MKEKKVRKITIRLKKTPKEYSEIKKRKNVEKFLRIARATNDPIQKKILMDKAEKLIEKYKKQKSWINSLLKKN